MLKESDILYENGSYWICKSEKKGYEVYQTGVTHSTRCAIIGYEGDIGFQRAKLECDKRAEVEKKKWQELTKIKLQRHPNT